MNKIVVYGMFLLGFAFTILGCSNQQVKKKDEKQSGSIAVSGAADIGELSQSYCKALLRAEDGPVLGELRKTVKSFYPPNWLDSANSEFKKHFPKESTEETFLMKPFYYKLISCNIKDTKTESCRDKVVAKHKKYGLNADECGYFLLSRKTKMEDMRSIDPPPGGKLKVGGKLYAEVYFYNAVKLDGRWYLDFVADQDDYDVEADYWRP